MKPKGFFINSLDSMNGVKFLHENGVLRSDIERLAEADAGYMIRTFNGNIGYIAIYRSSTSNWDVLDNKLLSKLNWE